MSPRRPRAVARGAGAAVAAATVLLAAGCGTGSSGGAAGGRITVFAAASLTDAFGAEARALHAATGADVRFSFAGSQDLVAQLRNGAPADAMATADTATMRSAAGELQRPARVFAHNVLVIAVAEGNPHHITSLADLADPRLDVVLADPSVPAGKYAAEALAVAHVHVHPRSLELDVRSVLTKVSLGEADAGIVYATDARSAAGSVDAVPVPDSPVATYPIGCLTAAGRTFADFVLSPRGQAILRRYGFRPS